MAAKIVSKILMSPIDHVTRSALVHFTNATDLKLNLADKNTSYGRWFINASPPSTIEPNAHVDFRVGTKLGLGDVKADVRYSVEGGGEFTLNWHNPAIGSNSYEQKCSGWLRLSRDGEGKGTHSEVTYKLEKPIFVVSRKHWS